MLNGSRMVLYPSLVETREENLAPDLPIGGERGTSGSRRRLGREGGASGPADEGGGVLGGSEGRVEKKGGREI